MYRDVNQEAEELSPLSLSQFAFRYTCVFLVDEVVDTVGFICVSQEPSTNSSFDAPLYFCIQDSKQQISANKMLVTFKATSYNV